MLLSMTIIHWGAVDPQSQLVNFFEQLHLRYIYFFHDRFILDTLS